MKTPQTPQSAPDQPRHHRDNENEAIPARRTAASGQVFVMFAVLATALMGALGLAVDLGVAFAERRSMQNAADAGALAGARIIAKSNPASPLSAQTEVTAVVNANAMDLGTITSLTCAYVNDAGTDLGACSSTVPTGATGVRVAVTEQHSTFFLRVVPGAPDTVDTGADAMAHVKVAQAPRDGPYLPCAIDTQLADSHGTMDILVEGDDGWELNPSAIGRTFVIHGPQIERCNAKASRYKGLADTSVNRSKNPPGWFNYKEGDAAGLIYEDVEGPDGCKAGQEAVNCVAFLPIVVNDPPESGNNRELWAIAFAPFYITAPKSNEHHGKLISNYMVYGRGQNGDFGWYWGHTGPIVVRLTG